MSPTDNWTPTVPTTPDIDEKVQPEYSEADDRIDHAAERALVRQTHHTLTDIRSGDLI